MIFSYLGVTVGATTSGRLLVTQVQPGGPRGES
jgi:hypothetical protein